MAFRYLRRKEKIIIKKNLKVAYKIIGVYLSIHLVIAIGILCIINEGVKKIEDEFLQKHISNAEKYMMFFDEELLTLRDISNYIMQSENVIILNGRDNYLSLYEAINHKKLIREELIVLSNQYKMIDDMGIYIENEKLWISTIEGFQDAYNVDKVEGSFLEVIDNELYLRTGSERSKVYTEVYIKIDRYEFNELLDRMKFEANNYADVWVDGKLLAKQSTYDKENKEIKVKSSIYPIEVYISIGSKLSKSSEYLYLYGIGIVILLIPITLGFSRYLNRVIHIPLRNIVRHVQLMDEENFEIPVGHVGGDEFDYVTDHFNGLKKVLEGYIRKSYEQEIRMKQMELDYLQSQIKPHFLYNCFFNITNMCKTYDIEKIEALTLALARYYRYITRTQQEMVTLQEEYMHMKNYLSIQGIRFEERVQIQIEEIPKEIESIQVPRLILQPIVENAYKYVFEDIENGGCLFIHVYENGEFIIIEIEDNGKAVDDKVCSKLAQKLEKVEGPITGLVNINQRLKYFCELNGVFFEKSSMGGLCTKVKIKK